jgi:hypothetical protein
VLDCVIVDVTKALCARMSMYAQKKTHVIVFVFGILMGGPFAFIHLGLRLIALTSFVLYFLSEIELVI